MVILLTTLLTPSISLLGCTPFGFCPSDTMHYAATFIEMGVSPTVRGGWYFLKS